MKFQTKLTTVFLGVAIITLGVALFASWQIRRLESSLYEITAVRMPSIQGLSMMSESLLTLDATGHRLSGERLSPSEFTEERQRQEGAWKNFQDGWQKYEPLPQTAAEAATWREFSKVAQTWKTEFQQDLAAFSHVSENSRRDSSAIASLDSPSFSEMERLLAELTRINYAVIDEARGRSAANVEGLNRLHRLMLFLGVAGFLGAAGMGIVMSRLISRPVRALSLALKNAVKTDPNRPPQELKSGDELFDITQSLHAMIENVRLGEARLQSLSDNLPESVVYQVAQNLDGSMRFLYVSAQVETLHGLPRAAVLADASLLYAQILDEDLPALLAAQSHSAATLSPFSLATRFRRKDGRIRHIYLSSSPHRLPDGRIVWDGVETDITERTEAQARLIASEVRFRAVFDHSIDAIGVSKNGRIVFVNPAFQTLFGYATAEDVIDRPVLEFVAPESHPQLLARVAARARGEELPPIFELTGRRQDGSQFEMELHSSPFVLDGESYMIVLHRDVSERKRNDLQIRSANRALNTIRSCHQQLVHAVTADGLLAAVCQVFVNAGQYRGAWAALVTEPGLRAVASASTPPSQPWNFSETWAANIAQREAMQSSTRSPQCILARDFLHNPDLAGGRAEAERHGFNSCLILPLRREKTLLGFLAIYASTANAFDEAESILLSELADDLAFGIYSLQEREQREQSEATVRALLVEAEQGRTALISILEDQMLAEQALHRSEEQFRSAMLNSAIGMALAHPDGRCFEVNPALCRILGYTREEMLVRDFQSTTYPDDLPADSRLFHQLLDGAIESYELEKRYIHKQGHVVWVQLNVSLVRDQQGQALHSISQIQDITERRNIQAAREEILGRLRLALKAGHLGTFRRNLVTGEGSWDEQTFALTCRPPSAGAPTLQDFLNMVHPDDRASVMAQMKATPERDGELSYRFRLVRGDGVLRHFITYAVAEPDSHGVQEWITGVFSDISDLVEVQERLKSSAQRLQLALSTSKLGVWRYDLKTRQTEWDDRMHEIYGIEKTALIPDRQRFMSLVLPDDREALESSWQQMLAGEADYRTRFRIRTPGGVLRQIEAHAIIQFDEAQRPIAVIGVNSDITEIVEATAESARLREQLQQAQKMETLGTLAAGVAHDFNNLLTGINGFVGLAASSLPPGHEAGDLLKQALRGAVNARDLVRRILDYSRGRADQAHALIELDALVRETAPLISAALPTNVSLSVTSSPDVAPVLADAGQLQQVLLNLCINGAHAIGSQPGTLTIELSTRRFAADANIPGGCSPGEYVCLSIRDTGCGMDEPTRRRIFEPFFTTKKAGVGTGLGLSIVRDIVNAHRGGIELISAPGKGTTFLIYFPAAARVSPPKPLSPTKVAHRGKGQRILVVDDEPSIAMVLRLSLQKTGYAPETYTSAADAWKRFSQMPDDFELIMVDENMPDVKGTEFARRARQIRPFVPIVLMSGQLLVDGVSGVEAHAVHTLKKPFEIPDLLSVVGSSLDQSAVSAN